MTKNEKIEQYKQYIEGYENKIKDIDDLLGNLSQWTNKKVNKTFFEKYYTLTDENGNDKNWQGKTWTRFSFRDKEWEWSKYEKKLQVGKYPQTHDIEIITTDTQQVIADLQKDRENIARWKKESEEKLASIQKTDEKKLLEDILAVYEKHGRPEELWRDILDSYEVKYPKE